jgi:phage-related minor tail protein
VKMRAQYEADIAKSLNDQTLTLEEQIGLQSEQSKITGLTSDEYEVQQALLAKKVELQRQGVDLASEEAVRVMQLTEQVVRQNQQIDKAKTQAQEWQNTWKSAGTGVTSSLSSAFVALFDKQQKAADVLKSGLSSTFKSLAQNIMDQMLKPLSDYIAKMLAQMAAYGFTGSVGVGTNASAGTASIPSNVAANGAYFSNGIAAFANGGTFTNSIVSSPTLFKFANGGAVKTGLMGEAGEEAIMPLRRDASGRLGVSAASGGGNNISISISVDASGGTQTQAAGDTSDNQGRKLGEAISAAVKNEILQQQRPGGLLSKRS